MHPNSKIRRVEKGTRDLVPVGYKDGYCTVDIAEDGLVFSPSPEDKCGAVIPDSALEKLGYRYIGKE